MAESIDINSLLDNLNSLEQKLVKAAKHDSKEIIYTRRRSLSNSSTSSASTLASINFSTHSSSTNLPQLQNLLRPMLLVCEGYRIEDGSENFLTSPQVENHIVIENAEQDTTWYFKYFLGNPHKTYVGYDDEKNPFILSVLFTQEDENTTSQTRAILWKKNGAERICIPTKKNDLSRMDILKLFNPVYIKWSKPKQVFEQSIIKEILNLEAQLNTKAFKFGVIYAKEGQVTDDEFFGNEEGSEAFNRFLGVLGEKIELDGWKGFRAGLDVTNGKTGTHSIYTEYLGYELMFHVSTLLPFSSLNAQQLERKRHIGNDIVVIIFQDDNSTPFSPTFMKTHFNHVFALVREEIVEGVPRYRCSICTKDDVPPYGPPLPNPPCFEDPVLFRRFLLAKLINAETSTYNSHTFGLKMVKTLESLISRLVETFSVEKPGDGKLRKTRSNSTSLSNFDDLNWEYGKGLKNQLLQEKEQVSKSISPRNDQRPMVWKPEVFCSNFPYKIQCAAFLSDQLFVATPSGLFLITENGKSTKLIWENGTIIQIAVVNRSKLLLVLTKPSKIGERLFSFPLSIFEEGEILTGKCKEYQIEKTKGCHIFAVSHENKREKVFQICVAIKNVLHLFEYEHHKFKKIKEFCLPDLCGVLNFCDNNRKLCVGFQTEFNLIDISSSQTHELLVASNKFSPLTTISLENEVLLCYNYFGIFRSFDGHQTREYDLKWTSVPTGLAYRFPFVLAFAAGSIEVRTLINGKLIQTISLSSIQFLTSQNQIFVSSSPEGKSESTIYRVVFGASS